MINGFDTPQAQALRRQLDANFETIQRYLALYAELYGEVNPDHTDRLTAIDAHLDALVTENKSLAAQLSKACAVIATPDGWRAPSPVTPE